MEAIARWIKRIGFAGSFVILALYFTFCAWSLPSTVKVKVTGTEIRRADVQQPDGAMRTNDIRYVTAQDLEGRPLMFQNTDTGWGWPPYFKFDSGDVAAQAINFSNKDSDAIVLVKYYGFRIHVLSRFPNVLSMRAIPPDYQPVPWLTIVVVVAHVILVGVLITVVRSLKEDIGGGQEK